ncbi:MAG: response regulator, partial [Actinobacteria bacterium]|nr:response regulator [Actinomycetota bacterium]
MTLKALVVDDEAPARSELRYLLDEAGGVEVIGEASNASEASQLIKAIPYDVVFLDIDMPGMSGTQLAEMLIQLDRPPSVIFVTAHSEHAVKAFEVSAVDYLVKPVELGRLKQALERLVP